MSRFYYLEVCVDTAEGLEIAAQHGVDRIELCAALGEGGLTPSIGMMKLAATLHLPTRVMVRPRQGDFIYSESELTVMLRDIESVAMLDLDGVVLGANKVSGELDEAALGRLTGQAKSAGLNVTLHRSFDVAPDLKAALSTAQSLGIDSILTSGGALTAWQGMDAIGGLVEALRDSDPAQKIELMAGVGINADTARDIIRASGISWVHGSCSRARDIESAGAARLGYSSPDHRRTDPVAIDRLRQVLEELSRERAVSV